MAWNFRTVIRSEKYIDLFLWYQNRDNFEKTNPIGSEQAPLRAWDDGGGNLAWYNWPDVLNAKYHVITNATYSCHYRNPVPAKFKHVTNIETCTLLCCDHIM